MQETHPSSPLFFRFDEPAGFRFPIRTLVAEKVSALPPIGDAEKFARPDWFNGPGADHGFTDMLTGAPSPQKSSLRVLCSNEGLFIGVHLQEPATAKLKRLVPADSPTGEVEVLPGVLKYAAWKDDHVLIAIDASHEHARHATFMLTNNGYASAHVEGNHYGESIHAINEHFERITAPWQHRALVAADAWYAFLSIPWSTLGLKAAPEVPLAGFNAIRMRAVEELRYSCWSRVSNVTHMAALDFGDLYLERPPAEVRAVDFGHPVADRNTLKLSVVGSGKIEGRGRLHATKLDQTISDESVRAELKSGATTAVELPYRIDFRDAKNTLSVELRDDGGRIFWRAQYALGKANNICFTDRYEWDKPQPNPEPGDENFVAKKRNYLLSRLPRMKRVTTAQGAPSDFCLESADGRVRFNLMEADACRKIAAFIETRFDNDLDRMAGASMFIHQRTFATHCNELTKLHLNMSPESALRLNGGHCYSRALSLAGVMREIHYAGSKQTYDARVMYVLGHVIVAVLEGDKRYLFDPTWGSFYYRHDNKAFATEEELAADLTLVDRYTAGRRNNFAHLASHALGPVGNVRWPSGAPVGAR